MDNATASDLLAEFEDQNEELRQRFFPGEPVLFETNDLDGPEPEIATPSFTDEQRVLIAAVLKAVVKIAKKS